MFLTSKFKCVKAVGAGILLFVLGSCGRNDQGSELKFRPFDATKKNVFFVVGAPNGLSGVATDVREMSATLSDVTNGYGWRVEQNGNASKAAILEAVKRYAAEVGDDGTLGLYFSGHGAANGTYMTANGMLGFGEITEAIKEARQTPLRRLLTFVDSCYSGNWVDGNGALPTERGYDWSHVQDGPSSYKELTPDQEERILNLVVNSITSDAERSSGITEFVTVAASRKNETSLDNGSQYGGAFTYQLRTVFKEFKTQDGSQQTVHSIGDFLKETSTRTWNETRHHTPVYVAHPQTLLDERLFGEGTVPPPPPTPEPQAVACPGGSSKYIASGANYKDKFCRKNGQSTYIAFAFNEWWKWLRTIDANTLEFSSVNSGTRKTISASDLWVTK